MDYLENLKKLINGELVAAIQYKLAAEALVGNDNFDYIKSHCEEHYEEEMGHFSTLISALMQRGVTPDLNLETIRTNAVPETMELDTSDVNKIREFFIKSEEEAIKAYREYHKQVVDDVDLDDIIIGIIADEREHKLDFERTSGSLSKEETHSEEAPKEEESIKFDNEEEEVDEEEEKNIFENLHKTPSYKSRINKFLESYNL